LFTQDRRDDDVARHGDAGEEAQRGEHRVGRGEGAGHAEHRRRRVGQQQRDPPAEPEGRRRDLIVFLLIVNE